MSEATRSRTEKVEYAFRYYKVDQYGFRVAGVPDLSSYVKEATLRLNVDVDVKFQFDLVMWEASGVLDPVADWVQIVALETVGAAATEYPLGVYRLSTPQEKMTSRSQEWRLHGYDRAIQLVRDKFTAAYTVAAGSNPVEEAVAICESAGIPASLITFPTTKHLLPADMTWEQGTAKLRAVNELLGAIGAYSPWADANGRLTTRVPAALESESPARKYATGAAGIVVPPADRQQDDTGLCNRVVVRVRNPDSIYSIVATLGDEAHPLHPVNLGYTRPKFYDLQTVADVATAKDYAVRRLEEGLSFYTRSSIRTFLDFGRAGNAFEVYELDLRDKEQNVLMEGNWRVKGWTMELRTDGRMLHELRRVEPVGGDVDLEAIFMHMDIRVFEPVSIQEEITVA